MAADDQRTTCGNNTPLSAEKPLPAAQPDWPYDADQHDPLTKLRIPVTCFKPGWSYLVSFDRESAKRPTDREAQLIVSFIDYERSKFRGHYQAELLERPLDLDGGHNTITLQKYGTDDWAFRRWTWERGPLFVPAYDRTPDQRLDLVGVLDRIQTIVDHLYQPWVEWKAAHPDLFGDVA